MAKKVKMSKMFEISEGQYLVAYNEDTKQYMIAAAGNTNTTVQGRVVFPEQMLQGIMDALEEIKAEKSASANLITH